MDKQFKDTEPDWLQPPKGYEQAFSDKMMDKIRDLRETNSPKPTFSSFQWLIQFACFSIFLFVGYGWYLHKELPTELPDENILTQMNVEKYEIVEYLQAENLMDFDVQHVAENIEEEEIQKLEKQLEPVLELTPDMKEAIREIAIEDIDIDMISDF